MVVDDELRRVQVDARLPDVGGMQRVERRRAGNVEIVEGLSEVVGTGRGTRAVGINELQTTGYVA